MGGQKPTLPRTGNKNKTWNGLTPGWQQITLLDKAGGLRVSRHVCTTKNKALCSSPFFWALSDSQDGIIEFKMEESGLSGDMENILNSSMVWFWEAFMWDSEHKDFVLWNCNSWKNTCESKVLFLVEQHVDGKQESAGCRWSEVDDRGNYWHPKNFEKGYRFFPWYWYTTHN